MPHVAFIGLGNMGSGMAANLAKAGREVRAFDLSAAALDTAQKNGAAKAASAADAVKGAEAVITMLPAGKHVRAVYEGEIFAAADQNAILIDCSTIDVATAKSVGAAAAAKGLAMLDAPVSGGIAAANGGTLTFMVGGTADHFARAEPYLKQMGKNVIRAGDSGAGQAAKVCNNMLLGISMIGTCEAFILAQKLGLDPQTFFDISSKASGQSWSMTSYCPVPGPVPSAPSNRDYEGGFAAALMLKDLKLALEAAQGVEASVPMGAQAESLYQVFAGLGGAGKDFSAIIKLLDGSWK
ncbi:3-hydroxyisobutyrate dehydrogenase [Alphaproteobacteria bacterium SO-S41]|nr:3-hydroxyisobutyrate dehydrogenase [Alphaproteobacteria bacterium SO-S41]